MKDNLDPNVSIDRTRWNFWNSFQGE